MRFVAAIVILCVPGTLGGQQLSRGNDNTNMPEFLDIESLVPASEQPAAASAPRPTARVEDVGGAKPKVHGTGLKIEGDRKVIAHKAEPSIVPASGVQQGMSPHPTQAMSLHPTQDTHAVVHSNMKTAQPTRTVFETRLETVFDKEEKESVGRRGRATAAEDDEGNGAHRHRASATAAGDEGSRGPHPRRTSASLGDGDEEGGAARVRVGMAAAAALMMWGM